MATRPAKRSSADDPVIWKAGWHTKSKTDDVRRFVVHNPFFTLTEMEVALGIAQGDPGYRPTAESLVSRGELKRPATGVYCHVAMDSSHPEVLALIGREGARQSTPASLARQSEKATERESMATATQIARMDAPDTLRRMHMRVFSIEDAAERLGHDPRPAIDTLLARGLVHSIHPGLYRKSKVDEHGEEVVAWARDKGERASRIARSIDVSEDMHSVRDGLGPMEVISIARGNRKSPDRPERIFVNFRRLGWISAIAGGKGKTMPLWRSATDRTGLSDEAAAFIASEIFAPGTTFGEILAIADGWSVARHPDLLPCFRSRGSFDMSARTDEDGPSRRCRTLRDRQDKGLDTVAKETVLYIDDREDRRIVEMLKGIPNLHVIVCRLETGDFRARWGSGEHEQLVIERKTATDLARSIETGRMRSQALALAGEMAKGVRCILLVQGDPHARLINRTGIGSAKTVGMTTVSVATTKLAAMGVLIDPVPSWQMAGRAILDHIRYSVDPSLLSLDADDEQPHHPGSTGRDPNPDASSKEKAQ